MQTNPSKYFLLLGTLLLPCIVFAQQISQQELLSPSVYARVISEPIGEMSGIIKSNRGDNLYWVHNDSGNAARIFAITAEARSVLPTYSKFTRYGEEPVAGKKQWEGFEVLFAENVDWEDIALDKNYLYLADVGNNANARRDLSIYAISEIDPTASTRSAVVQKYPVIYPEQKEFPPGNWHYDSESLFTFNDTLYLITKHRETGKPLTFEAGANLYRLDTRFTDKDNLLTYVDSNALLTAATGADVSPDGSTLAVISYTDLWLFEKPASGDKWLSSAAHRFPLDTAVFKQTEAITWQDDNSLIITNENRDIFKIEIAQLQAQ